MKFFTYLQRHFSASASRLVKSCLSPPIASSSSFSFLFNSLNPTSPIHPPIHKNVGTAVIALSNPKVQAMVAQPALFLINPAQTGPTKHPPANAILKSPYTCAYAPRFPHLFPLSAFILRSFASATTAISAMNGGKVSQAQPNRGE